MKKLTRILALVMMFVMAFQVVAQDQPGGGRQRGGRGGPGGGGPGGGRFGFGMMGMGGGGGGASALLMLLGMEEVRKEVNVSNEAYEEVQKVQREAMSAMGNFRDMSDEERAKVFKDMNTKAQELLDEVVDPAGQKRLMGLLLQQQGNSAVTNEVIAKEINLAADKVKEIGDAIRKSAEGSMAKMQELRPAGGGPPSEADREEMGKKMREIRDEMRKASDAAVDGLLTDDQKKAVETLKGEKFTFPEGGFGFGFGGRGGRGPGGPGGGRPRPGSDN